MQAQVSKPDVQEACSRGIKKLTAELEDETGPEKIPMQNHLEALKLVQELCAACNEGTVMLGIGEWKLIRRWYSDRRPNGEL